VFEYVCVRSCVYANVCHVCLCVCICVSAGVCKRVCLHARVLCVKDSTRTSWPPGCSAARCSDVTVSPTWKFMIGMIL